MPHPKLKLFRTCMLGLKCEFADTFSQVSRLIWQELVDLRIDAASKVHRTRLSACFSINRRSPDADHCPVGWSVLQCVGNQPELGPVFARDDSMMRLIPIEDEVALVSLCHEISVHENGNSTRRADLHARGMDKLPTRSWETIFGRVNSFTGALVFVIAHIQFNRKSAADVHSIDVVIRTNRAHNLVIERTIMTVCKPDDGWKLAQRPLWRRGLPLAGNHALQRFPLGGTSAAAETRRAIMETPAPDSDVSGKLMKRFVPGAARKERAPSKKTKPRVRWTKPESTAGPEVIA